MTKSQMSIQTLDKCHINPMRKEQPLKLPSSVLPLQLTQQERWSESQHVGCLPKFTVPGPGSGDSVMKGHMNTHIFLYIPQTILNVYCYTYLFLLDLNLLKLIKSMFSPFDSFFLFIYVFLRKYSELHKKLYLRF